MTKLHSNSNKKPERTAAVFSLSWTMSPSFPPLPAPSSAERRLPPLPTSTNQPPAHLTTEYPRAMDYTVDSNGNRLGGGGAGPSSSGTTTAVGGVTPLHLPRLNEVLARVESEGQQEEVGSITVGTGGGGNVSHQQEDSIRSYVRVFLPPSCFHTSLCLLLG